MAATDIYEVWMNPNAGLVYIDKTDQNGKVQSTCILPGQKFNITPDDRRNNTERAWKPEADLFSNGTLSQVKLLDTEADYADLTENPNIIGESEIKDLFNLKAVEFKKRIAGITNDRVLTRIKEYSEDEKAEATVAQQKAVKARLEELIPEDDPSRRLPDRTKGEITPIYMS